MTGLLVGSSVPPLLSGNPMRSRKAAPPRGTAAEIIGVDLRLGRITHRIDAPLADCHLDIDDRGAAVALAARAAGGDHLSVFLVPLAELFAGAHLHVPTPAASSSPPVRRPP